MTLFLPRWLMQSDPLQQRVSLVTDHAMLVDSTGRIVAVADALSLSEAHPDAQRVNLSSHVLMPGLVNAHTHAAMTLLRGVADDLALMEWLQGHIWPCEQAHLSDRFVYEGTLLAASEMLQGGVTLCNDMYLFPEASARAFAEAGMRATVGLPVMPFPTVWAADAQSAIARGLALCDADRAHPTLRYCFAPHAPYSVDDATWRKLATYCAELGLGLHTHLHETATEIADSLTQYGKRPLQRLADLGVCGPDFTAFHGVHLNAAELDWFATERAHLVHCPVSNLKLASGIAPISAARQRGVRLAIGTDGAASNNRLDMWQELRYAALLAKGAGADATAFCAAEVLFAATQGGADALGWGDQVGSLAVGKEADCIAVDLSALELQPVYNPLSHLTYVVGREHVSDVWVNGEQRVANGVPTRLDPSLLRASALLWQAKIENRNGY